MRIADEGEVEGRQRACDVRAAAHYEQGNAVGGTELAECLLQILEAL